MLSVFVFGCFLAFASASEGRNRIYEGPHANIDQCLDVEEKLRCGHVTFDERECRSRGCCWSPCTGCGREVPWCYLAHRMLSEECDVEYEEKEDCGYYGITEGECILRGCCWQPSYGDQPNDPWCFNKKYTTLRLVGGSDDSEGRVEVKHNEEWGTVCDDGWNNADADVVCRQLGYTSGKAYRGAYFGAGSGQIWMDGVSCYGDEEVLEACDFNGWGNHDCSHGEDAGVKCSHEEGSGDSWGYYYYDR